MVKITRKKISLDTIAFHFRLYLKFLTSSSSQMNFLIRQFAKHLNACTLFCFYVQSGRK